MPRSGSRGGSRTCRSERILLHGERASVVGLTGLRVEAVLREALVVANDQPVVIVEDLHVCHVQVTCQARSIAAGFWTRREHCCCL